jgi:hypothetical protein
VSAVEIARLGDLVDGPERATTTRVKRKEWRYRHEPIDAPRVRGRQEDRAVDSPRRCDDGRSRDASGVEDCQRIGGVPGKFVATFRTIAGSGATRVVGDDGRARREELDLVPNGPRVDEIPRGNEQDDGLAGTLALPCDAGAVGGRRKPFGGGRFDRCHARYPPPEEGGSHQTRGPMMTSRAGVANTREPGPAYDDEHGRDHRPPEGPRPRAVTVGRRALAPVGWATGTGCRI